MGKKNIPKGWRNYSPVGQCIFGTKFLPFKVPLNEYTCRGIPKEEWFTPEILLKQCPKLRAIIDLTNTTRYYDPQLFTQSGICHRKIPNCGHGTLPPPNKLHQFVQIVDRILAQTADEPDALIGVHCTHGLHRTGYFICYYMVSQMKMDPYEVVARFEECRGHPMERENYVKNILEWKRKPRTERKVENWRTEPRSIPKSPKRYNLRSSYKFHSSNRDNSSRKNGRSNNPSTSRTKRMPEKRDFYPF